MHMRTIIMVALCVAADSAFATESSVPFLNADDVHAEGITGLGVTVAVIDTGIYYDHPGLTGSIAPGGVSIINGEEVYDDGADIWGVGHGTYMSLIITDQTGVAHDASFVGWAAPTMPVHGAISQLVVEAESTTYVCTAETAVP